MRKTGASIHDRHCHLSGKSTDAPGGGARMDNPDMVGTGRRPAAGLKSGAGLGAWTAGVYGGSGRSASLRGAGGAGGGFPPPHSARSDGDWKKLESRFIPPSPREKNPPPLARATHRLPQYETLPPTRQ